MDVSVIIPIYNPDEKIMQKIDNVIKGQDYKGRIKVIKVNKRLGLSTQLNLGIKKAKTEIVVSLHQDCVPASKDWLRKLIAPFKDKEVVASVSKVELPYEFWKKFDLLAKMMSAKEQKILTPLLDEKGCAYRKSVIKKVGFFDTKNFKTAGEDFDMWVKLKKNGKISYPNCKIFHYHEHSSKSNTKKDYIFKNRFKKELQLSNCFGALFRIYKRKIPRWHIGLLKSTPIFGWLIFLFNFQYKKLGTKSLFWIPLSLIINLIYVFGFWKGFFEAKQTI